MLFVCLSLSLFKITAGDTLPESEFTEPIQIKKSLARYGSNLPYLVLRSRNTVEPNDGTLKVEASFFDPGEDSLRIEITSPPTFLTFGEISRRGSSSRKWRKPSFKFETQVADRKESAIEPFDLPKGSDWILSGRYQFDRSLIRNDLIYRLSRDLGEYAPRTRLVELFVDSRDSSALDYRRHYFGVYSLTEKIERGRHRIEIPKRDREFPELGGYVFKRDNLDPGDQGFEVAGFGRLAWVYPKEEKITQNEREEIVRFLDRLRKDLSEQNSLANFQDRIDVNSWLVYHWLNLFSKNGDGLIASSFFHLKPGKESWILSAGPVWDFDRTMGSLDGKDSNPLGWDGTGGSSRYWHDPRAPIWGMLMADPDFRQLQIDFWQEHRRGVLSWKNIDSIILELSAKLNRKEDPTISRRLQKSPAERNFAKWKECPPRGGSHLSEIAILRSWIQARLKWIDAQFTQPPTFTPLSGRLKPGDEIEINHQGDEIYYTLDGSDPRGAGGIVSPDALAGKIIKLNDSSIVTARSRKGTGLTSWSSPTKAIFVVEEPDN